jgi:urease accessory protein
MTTKAEQPPCSALEVEHHADASRVVVCRSEPPLRLLTPSSGTGTAWAMLASYGGGMVQGDRVRLRIRCGRGARALVGTQANGRVYRHLEAATARQETTGLVESGALLVVFPDPLVLHADSRFAQRQDWQVAADGSLVLGDWFQCGRSDNGEQFAYLLWENETALRVGEKLAVVDRFRSEPPAEDPRAPGRFGDANLMLTLHVLGPVANGLLAALEPFAAFDEVRQVPGAPTDAPALRCAVNRLETAEGFVLRALGGTREDFGPLVTALFAHLAAPDLLAFDPLARRM